MKRGSTVAVCHDGKWGRRIKGKVIKTKNGFKILVQFPHPETSKTVEFWARRSRPIRHVRWGKGKYASIGSASRYSRWGGWADIEYFCPWFAVYNWKDE